MCPQDDDTIHLSSDDEGDCELLPISSKASSDRVTRRGARHAPMLTTAERFRVRSTLTPSADIIKCTAESVFGQSPARV